MDLLTNPGKSIYVVAASLACLGGLFVTFITLFGLAWGGTNNIWFDLATVFGNLSTIGLFAGLLGSFSRKRKFPLIALASATFVPIVVALLYSPLLWRRDMSSLQVVTPKTNLLALLGINFTMMTLAYSKYRQLCTPR